MNSTKFAQTIVHFMLPLPFGIYTILNIIRCCINNQWTITTMVFAGLFAITCFAAFLLHFREDGITLACSSAGFVICATAVTYMASNLIQNGVFLTPLV